MLSHIEKPLEEVKRKNAKPIVSTVLSNGTLIETVYKPDQYKTLFCIADNHSVTFKEIYSTETLILKPYSPNNNLIKNNVVLLPSAVEQYKSNSDLIEEIQCFIHRYVDVNSVFEKVAAYYVLFTWVFDSFNELPYLRVKGDFGSGKTRFLLTVGSICYKPIFASGASSISPLFRILDEFHGTLIIDESDFRFSDEKADLVKILNNGTTKGFPVLRSEAITKGEFMTRTPKLRHLVEFDVRCTY